MSNSKLSGFLETKQLWVWWVVYLAITGIIFGTVSLIFHLFKQYPLIGVLALIAIGVLWGSIKYYQHNKKDKTQ